MLKYLLVLLLGVSSMMVHATEITRDEAQIRSNLNSFSTLADQGAFEYLGRLLAPELTVDYTSLFGGEPELVSRTELMKRWAAFLPGFDATFHDLSNMQVTLGRDIANATVDFTAMHWLGNEGFWAVSGQYEFALIRSGDNWEITSVKLNAGAESGSRNVLEKAPQFAQQNLKSRSARTVSYQ